MADCYVDVVNLLNGGDVVFDSDGSGGMLKRTVVRSIGARFSGVIPDSTRAKIRKAMSDFESIFLIAEPVFSLKVQIVEVPVDPIVAGWDGETMWYIDDFDITPLEEAALLQPLA